MAGVPSLSRREREVMDIIHGLGQGTAAQVRAGMREPPSNAAVRSTLRILFEKGHLTYEQDGPRYLYSPTAAPKRAGRSAMQHVLQTFFGGSVEGAMAALLEMDESKLTLEERERIQGLIQRAQREGR